MIKQTIVWAFLLTATGATACNRSEPAKNEDQAQSTKPVATHTIDSPPTSYADTLFIQDDFASQPFQIDSVSIPAVLDLFNTGQLVKKPVNNKFVEDQTDTLITIRKAGSYIQLYAVSTEEKKCFYKAALIQDSLPIFSQPLQIGQSKDRVKQTIKTLAQEDHLPDIIQISNGEGTDYVYLVFRNNKLTTVKFQPYLD